MFSHVYVLELYRDVISRQEKWKFRWISIVAFIGYINIDQKNFRVFLFFFVNLHFYLFLALIQTFLLFLVMGDPIDHATGIEKRELLAKLAGNDNPFDMKVFKRGPGTKENPNLIPSAFDARLVGCICEEDQTFVQWMWLHQVWLQISDLDD